MPNKSVNVVETIGILLVNKNMSMFTSVCMYVCMFVFNLVSYRCYFYE